MSQKMSKVYFDLCVGMKIIYSNMFYAKIFHLLFVSATKVSNIIVDKTSYLLSRPISDNWFRYQAEMKFWKIIKYLSTFYIRFKRTVSNQRNVHRRFPTTTWIEDRSVLTCCKSTFAKELENSIAKKILGSERLINDCKNENASQRD